MAIEMKHPHLSFNFNIYICWGYFTIIFYTYIYVTTIQKSNALLVCRLLNLDNSAHWKRIPIAEVHDSVQHAMIIFDGLSMILNKFFFFFSHCAFVCVEYYFAAMDMDKLFLFTRSNNLIDRFASMIRFDVKLPANGT